MQVVDRYWSAICWDFQHLLSFSAYEYFQWVPAGPTSWRRKRPVEELLGFFGVLMNMPGTMTNEAVLCDPETIEWMGSRTRDDDGPSRPRIFGHTEEISLLKTLIEVKVGKSLPRPVIPGLELRKQRSRKRTLSAVERAQARNVAKAEREMRRQNRRLQSAKGT
ncbi:hypothetical protein [Mycolicibacterium palauense]|uniref:hypothetical protein n=1 Tax=Mycolicibacterium palauense TaxID=2034511 RepID=UPI000BFEC271|nr:hypothetical protein [Mycolicibacterium palauense]